MEIQEVICLSWLINPEEWPDSNRWTNRIHDDDITDFISYLLDKEQMRCL